MKNIKRTAIMCALATAGMSASGANSATLYQSVSNLAAAPIINGYCSVCSDITGTPNGQYIGQAFALNAASTVASLSVALDSYYNFPTDVTVDFYDDLGGTVGSKLFDKTFSSFASDTKTAFGTDVVGINLAAPLALSAGNYLVFFSNQYELAIPAFSGAGDAVVQGATSGGSLGGLNYYSTGQAIGVRLSDSQITAAVPEISTWAMMILGFGVVGFGLRSARKSDERFTSRVRSAALA